MSFRREKFVPKGGPDGGNGGDGGDVVVVGDAQISTLLDLRYQRLYRAGRGEHGRGKDQHGRRGESRIIAVPLGTVIHDVATGELLGDIQTDQQRVVVARGGKGGRGNATFATPTNRAPRYAQPGLPGEEKELLFELKLLADVGLIGRPNAGKSTLISVISAARPKIADYPFTTVVPNLGVVRYGDDGSFVVADIPGLIEGAHRGEGLGHHFLRHVSRTRLLVHLLDAGGLEGHDPRKSFEAINRELKYFDEELARKPQIVVATKIDLLDRWECIPSLETFFTERSYPFCAISAVTGTGLHELKALIVRHLDGRR